MMKFAFALVALLHLCNSYKLNLTLNGEIIKRLETLNNKVNITSSMVRVPTQTMKSHASSCVSVFVRELRNLLDKVTIHEENAVILQELNANLHALDPHQQIDHKCQTAAYKKSLKPFRPFILFLMKLNNSKKR